MLSRLVITFLPRSKCLLISWLQSPSAVILEPPKNKVWHCFHCFPIYLPWSGKISALVWYTCISQHAREAWHAAIHVVAKSQTWLSELYWTELMGLDTMILVFWMLIFKPTFLLSSFTFIKRLFSSSSLSAIKVVPSAYLRWLIFLLAILIPAWQLSKIKVG